MKEKNDFFEFSFIKMKVSSYILKVAAYYKFQIVTKKREELYRKDLCLKLMQKTQGG